MIVKNDHSAPAGVAIILMTAFCLLGMLIRYWWVDTQQPPENDLTQESLQATQTALAATQTPLAATQTAIAQQQQLDTTNGVLRLTATSVIIGLFLAAALVLVLVIAWGMLRLRVPAQPTHTAQNTGAPQYISAAQAETTAITRPNPLPAAQPMVLHRNQPAAWDANRQEGTRAIQHKPLKLRAGETKTAALPRDRS